MKDNDYRYSSHGSGSWFSSLLWMMSGGAIAAVILIAGNIELSNRLFSAFNALMGQPQSQPRVDVKSLVLQQVREASELTTAVFTMQAVVPTEQDAAIAGFVIGKTKLLYIAQGEVRAGVDLSQIRETDIQISGDGVQLQLPAAQVLDKKIDVNKSQVYDYDRGLLGLGPDTAPDLQTQAQQQALAKITAAACAEGLVQTASDRARQVVTQLLTSAGYKSVTVTIQPVSSETCSTLPEAQRSN